MTESILANEFWLLMIRFLIGSTLLLAAIWLLERTGKIQNLRLRSSLWKVGVLCSLMLLIPVNYPLAPTYQFEEKQTTFLGVPPIEDTEINQVQQGSIETIGGSTGNSIANITESQLASFSATVEPSPVTERVDSKRFQILAELDLSNWLIICWVFVSFVLLLRLSAAYVLGQRSLGIRHQIGINDLRYKVMLSLCQDIGISSTVNLTQSSQVVSPVTLLNNEICLPEWTGSQISHDELRSLLAHELGHIKARDLQTRLGLYLLFCVFFFQPLFLLASNRLQNMSEFLADEFAANQCGSKSVVNVLLNCAEKIQSHRSYPWSLAMLDNTSRLNHRINRLLQEQSMGSRFAGMLHRIVLCALCLSIFAVPSFEYGKANELTDTQVSVFAVEESIDSQEFLSAELNEDAVAPVLKDSLLTPIESEPIGIETTVEPFSPPQLGSSEFTLAEITQTVPEEKLEPKTLVLDVVEQAQAFDQPNFDLLAQTDILELSAVNIVESQSLAVAGTEGLFGAIVSQLLAAQSIGEGLDSSESTAEEENTPEAIIAQIESNEVALYNLFNELNSSDEYDIVCTNRLDENSDTPAQICEPALLEKFREENRQEVLNGSMNDAGFWGKLRESFLGPWELSDQELRARAAEPIRLVQLELETLITSNPEMLARLQVIGGLQEEYLELARESIRKDKYFMRANNPDSSYPFRNDTGDNRPASSKPWFSAPPPGRTEHVIHFGYRDSPN